MLYDGHFENLSMRLKTFLETIPVMSMMMKILLMTMLMMTMAMLMMQEGGNARLAVSFAPPRDSATLPHFGSASSSSPWEIYEDDYG